MYVLNIHNMPKIFWGAWPLIIFERPKCSKVLVPLSKLSVSKNVWFTNARLGPLDFIHSEMLKRGMGGSGPSGKQPLGSTISGAGPPLGATKGYLSEPTRKLALWAVCLPAAKAHKRCLRHTETAGPWRMDQACGPRPPVPNVAFWTDKKTSSLSCLSSSLTLLSEPTRKKLALWAVCLPAPKAHKRLLRHTETAGPWRTDQACGPRPPVPNVAFWTDKKTSSLSCLSSSRGGSQTAPSPHRNSRALKDGPGLRATAPSA